MNQITSYLDGSNLYGSSAEEQHGLRLLDRGKLRYTGLNSRCPAAPPATQEAAPASPGSRCGGGGLQVGRW